MVKGSSPSSGAPRDARLFVLRWGNDPIPPGEMVGDDAPWCAGTGEAG